MDSEPHLSDPELTPTSPGEENSDEVDVLLSPEEPIPGINGVPVRCELWNATSTFEHFSDLKYYGEGYDVRFCRSM
jgi:hypothetical protein